MYGISEVSELAQHAKQQANIDKDSESAKQAASAGSYFSISLHILESMMLF